MLCLCIALGVSAVLAADAPAQASQGASTWLTDYFGAPSTKAKAAYDKASDLSFQPLHHQPYLLCVAAQAAIRAACWSCSHLYEYYCREHLREPQRRLACLASTSDKPPSVRNACRVVRRLTSASGRPHGAARTVTSTELNVTPARRCEYTVLKNAANHLQPPRLHRNGSRPLLTRMCVHVRCGLFLSQRLPGMLSLPREQRL